MVVILINVIPKFSNNQMNITNIIIKLQKSVIFHFETSYCNFLGNLPKGDNPNGKLVETQV